MINQTFIWHPKYRVYGLGHSVLLISESDAFCLCCQQYPFINGQDGTIDQHLFTAHAIAPATRTLYRYALEQLRQQQIVCSSFDNGVVYRLAEHQPLSLLLTKPDFCIYNLSCAGQAHLDIWIQLLTDFMMNNHYESRIIFLFVDDFLTLEIDGKLRELLSENSQYCVIKMTGENIWITSLSQVKSSINFKRLQQQLWRNQPVRKLVNQIFPNENNSLTFDPKIRPTAEELILLRQLLQQQLCSYTRSIVVFELKTQQYSRHTINPYFDQNNSLSRQLTTPVVLDACEVRFNRDSGSRFIAPELTLKQLLPLLSPLTGVITHLSLIESCRDTPIKIYQAGFFQQPAASQCHELDNDSFVRSSLGKGVSVEQAKISALAEAIERYGALYRGDEPFILARKSQLERPCYDYQQIAALSQSQYARFSDVSHFDSRRKQAVKLYQDSPIRWLPCWSLSKQRQVYVPLSICFDNIPFDDKQFGQWYSNGSAAGNTLEEAILQALFELVERDAIAIWWYNQVERPPFDLNHLPPQTVNAIRNTLGPEIDFWLLDLTTDMGIPVILAVAQHIEHRSYSFGFGCHFQPELAAQRALTELCQLHPFRNRAPHIFDLDAIQPAAFLHPQADACAVAVNDYPTKNMAQSIDAVVEKLSMLGFETLVVDYSRVDLPLKTVRVIVPGLSHVWPQLANPRLYQLPVKLGWLPQIKTESAMNPQGFYI